MLAPNKNMFSCEVSILRYCYMVIVCTDESCIGVVCSNEGNVGKSLTLQILAKGQGMDRRAHPLLFSGGGIRMSAVHLCKFLKIMHYNTIRDMGYLENRIQS